MAGLDLGEKRQALAVTGADGEVLARRSPQVSVHDLGPYLDGRCAGAGGGVCRAVGGVRADGVAVDGGAGSVRGARAAVVCVQPLVSRIAREQET